MFTSFFHGVADISFTEHGFLEFKFPEGDVYVGIEPQNMTIEQIVSCLRSAATKLEERDEIHSRSRD